MQSSKRAHKSKLILIKQHDLWTYTQVLDAKDLHAHILYELDVGTHESGNREEGGGGCSWAWVFLRSGTNMTWVTKNIGSNVRTFIQ